MNYHAMEHVSESFDRIAEHVDVYDISEPSVAWLLAFFLTAYILACALSHFYSKDRGTHDAVE